MPLLVKHSIALGSLFVIAVCTCNACKKTPTSASNTAAHPQASISNARREKSPVPVEQPNEVTISAANEKAFRAVQQISGISLPALEPSDLTRYSCIGATFLSNLPDINESSPRSLQQEKEDCARRVDLDFTSAITPSDSTAITNPQGSPTPSGKPWFQFYDCKSAGISDNAINEMFWFASTLAHQVKSSISPDSCSIVHKVTTAGSRQFASNYVEFFHSIAQRNKCFSNGEDICPGTSVEVGVLARPVESCCDDDGNSLPAEYDRYILKVNSGHETSFIFMNICSSTSPGKVRPCEYDVPPW